MFADPWSDESLTLEILDCKSEVGFVFQFLLLAVMGQNINLLDCWMRSVHQIRDENFCFRVRGFQFRLAHKIIAVLNQDFIFDGCTILVHGLSRVVLEILKTAAQNNKLFRVLCTEGRPDGTGVLLSNELSKLNIPVKLLLDSAVAYSMDEVDMVFVGENGVVESSGIINMMGTYQIALVAHSMNKPVYVATENKLRRTI